MNENVKNFIDSVQNKDYTAAKDMFQGAMAEKISAAFENKKIELASQMTSTNESTESDEIDQIDEDADQLDEGKIRNFLFRTLNREKDKRNFNAFHWETAQRMVDKHLGKGSKEGKEIIDKHHKLASGTKYTDMSDKAAKKALADNMEELADDLQAAKKKQK